MMKKLTIFCLSFCFCLSTLFSQYTFNGTVIDESGEALIGASILIKKTTNGTITDIVGNFSITSQDSIVTLIVDYTGYSSVEQEVSYRSNPISIVLSEGAELTEVAVTGLGIKKEKKELGYGVTVISRERSKKRRKNRAEKKLQGQVAGIQPTQATSSNNAKIRIRGKSTLQNQMVVDGIPFSSKRLTLPNEKIPHHTEDYSAIQENRFYEVTKEPLSTFSIDVDAASYSNLRRFLNNGQQPPIDAVRIEEMVNYFDYQYPQPKTEHPFAVITEVSDCPWNKENRLLHIGMQGKQIASENLPPSNLVFLLDVSGSMNAPNKLPLLQASLSLLVNQLRSVDKVAIVVYAGAAGTVLPATSGNNKQKIKEALNKLRAGGSTAGAAGIKLAYKIAKENFQKEGNNRVILATDGDFNVGTSSDAELVRLIEEERKSGVFLTVLGFGMGNYKDNKMQELANKGNGNHAYIDNINEAKKVLVNEFGGTLFTIAKDVKFQIEFNPSKVQAYRLIGYENRMLAAEDFNNDKKDAGELGAGHTVTALYEVIPTGVKSEYIASVDDLKYQATKTVKKTANSKELLTIKLRYKKPDGLKSRLIEQVVIDQQIPLAKTSDNFRFSAAVAEFGLLLRNSTYKGKASFAQSSQLAKNAKGKDENGYRTELIRLIEMAELMRNSVVAEKK